jgi:hypothetical protein
MNLLLWMPKRTEAKLKLIDEAMRNYDPEFDPKIDYSDVHLLTLERVAGALDRFYWVREEPAAQALADELRELLRAAAA